MEDAIEMRQMAIRAGLEAARIEVLERLAAAGLPTEVRSRRMRVVANEDGSGWSSQWDEITIPSVNDPHIMMMIRDETVEFQSLGMRPILEPIAYALDETTELGVRPHTFFPDMRGREAILIRYVIPMSVATRKSALMAMRSPHLWPRKVRSCGHQMSSPLAEAST